KKALSPAALRHGEQQLHLILRDRPTMAKYGDKAQVLYQWAARKLAGEDLGEYVRWDATEPDISLATSAPPRKGANFTGQIALKKTYLDGNNKSEELSFEQSWVCIVFELYNIASATEFDRSDIAATNGKMTKAEYVSNRAKIESVAVEKSRAFYIHVYLPWAT